MRRQPISKGFSTGLKIWLLFLISLFGMGYSAPLSIFLGAIGGLASGLIVDWWVSKEIEPEPKEAAEDGLAEETKVRKKRSQYSSLKQRSKKRKQQQEGTTNWWQQLRRRS